MRKGKMYVALAAAVVLTISGGVTLRAADTVLDTVYVNADKDKQEHGTLPGGFVNTKTEVGVLGKKDTMEVPFSVTNITQKTMEVFGGPDKPQDSIFVNSPSVRQTGSILHGDFYFRGMRTNGTNYYVNGVPGVLTQFNTPTYIFDNVDIISGANVGLFGTGVQYETTAPGGVISAHTKVAPEERVMDYTQTISGRGLFGEYLDYGERFGKDKEWGVRIMTENINGKTSVKGTKMVGQSIYANIDHRSEHTKDNLFVGYRNLDIQGGIRWFGLDSSFKTAKKLPGVPDGATNYGYDGMIKATHGWLAVFNHEQKFNDHWDGFFNFGYQDNNLDKNVMPNYSSYTMKPDGSLSGTVKADGTISGSKYASGSTPQTYWYWQVGTTAHYNTGDVKHNVTVSYNQAERERKTAFGDIQTVITGSLKEGITSTAPDPSYKTRINNKTKVKSIGIVDSMEYKKWDFVLGVHKHEAESKAASRVGNTDNWKYGAGVKTDAVSPTYGIVYRPNENLSIYGSHSEYFDAGLSVPKSSNGKTYINADEIIDPVKTKQNEIGVKYKKNDLLWTLAYYDIKRSTSYDVSVGDKLQKVTDGYERHKGVELSVNGKLADKWSVFGGLSHANVKNEGLKKTALNGKQINGTSDWTAYLGLQYNPNEKWSILGRAVYTGESPVFDEAFYVPGYVVYDLGVAHETKIGNIPTTLSLMCNNVFDKDYWMVSRGNQVYLSLPRTFTFTAKLHF